VLRRIFGLNRNEIRGEWRRLHNEELNDLYCPPKIIRVIELRRMTCRAYGEEGRCIQGFGGET
jgi:hypothetical protein